MFRSSSFCWLFLGADLCLARFCLRFVVLFGSKTQVGVWAGFARFEPRVLRYVFSVFSSLLFL